MGVIPDIADETSVSRAFKVLLESPYGAPTPELVASNVEYARACMHDSFMRGELPWCSHLLYPQPGILDDQVPAQRKLGISAGLAWGAAADKTAVYADLGLSSGMTYGIADAVKNRRPVVYRGLPFNILARLGITPVSLAPAADGTILSLDRLTDYPSL